MKVTMIINLMPVIMLLLGMALPTVKGGLTPTAYITAGGGFKTMTESMGIIRAWDESNILQRNTTHSGCVSGGCWFQMQFSYSKEFYESALGLNGDSVTEFLQKWGKRYGEAMQKGIKEEKFDKLDFSLAITSLKACLPFDGKYMTDEIDDIVDLLLADIDFPANNWYFYIETMLSSYITNYNTSLFSAERKGFANSIIVAGATLGPDIYGNNHSTKVSLSGQPTGITLLPISFVVKNGQTGEWQYTAAESPLEVSTGKGNGKQTVSLELLPPPLINVVASATSSFAGLLGSPTLFTNKINDILETKSKLLKTIEHIALGKAPKSKIKDCLPLGFQYLSSPTEGNNPSTLSPWDPLYRYMDGGYTDGTGIAVTIASMQKSCIEDPLKYNCTRGLRLSNIMGNGAEAIVSGGGNSIPRLFANCNCGSKSDDIGITPNGQIFAEEFQSDLNGTGWELYSTKNYPLGNNADPTLSYAWRGKVTTVSNKAYGITAGMNIDLIVIYPGLPIGFETIFPGFASNFAFSTIYADVAEEQYNSTLSLFKKWKLPEQWGDAVPTQSPEQQTSEL